MPGGSLDIRIDNNYKLTMTGGVQQIAERHLSQELVELLNSNYD